MVRAENELVYVLSFKGWLTGVAKPLKANLLRATLIWVVCGVLTWAQAVYEHRGETFEVKALVLPVMIVAWPLRIYFLTQPRQKPIPLI